MLISGAISIKAAIEGGRRVIEKVYIDKTKLKADRNLRYIYRKAQEVGVSVSNVSGCEVDRLSTNKNHGGICGEVGNYTYYNIEQLRQKINAFQNAAAIPQEIPFLVYLEGYEDPYNYGYCLRSLYAAGCSGVISPKWLWQDNEVTIIRSSAGASEFLPLYQVDRPDELLQELKYNGLTLLSATRKSAISIYDCDLTRPCVICFGGLQRGLSQRILSKSEQNIYIPYQNDFHNALSGASAVAVVAFELYRQRSK